jgi:branched-chain amino acid transport system substrate-binding protein
VNEEGGLAGFADATAGVDAAVQYVNNELGGIGGHQVSLERCAVHRDVDGPRCGQQLGGDQRVGVIVVGALATGNKALYDAIAGRKPVIVSNPLANDDFATPGVAALTPGLPNVVRGLAVFAATHLGVVTKLTVVQGADPAATYIAQGLFAPLAKRLGNSDVIPVPVPDTANSTEVRAALARAGVTSASTVVALVDVQLCIALYDALKALTISPTVITTDLCATSPMTTHLTALRSTDIAPDGWFFGGDGYSYFIPDVASGMATYLAKIRQYGPAGLDPGGLAGPAFAALLTTVKFYNEMPPGQATAATLAGALKSFRGPMMLVAGTVRCGGQPQFPSLCGTAMGVEQYRHGTWMSVADALNNQAIDTSGA